MQKNFFDSEVDHVTHLLESSGHMTLFEFSFGDDFGFRSFHLFKEPVPREARKIKFYEVLS